MPPRAIALLIACTLALPGCFSSGGDEEEGEAKPFAGVTVTVAIPPKSGFAQTWDSLLVEWSARTGGEVKVVEATAQQAAGGETGGSAASPGVDPAPVLFVVPVADVSDLAAGKLAPIPRDVQSESGLAWNDVAPGLAAAVGSLERRPTLLPISSPVLVLYYRSDLLAGAGLSPPATWDEYQKLLDALDRWAPGLSAAEPWGEEFRATMFLARAAGAARPPGQYSFLFDIETGEPLADSPPFVKALEQARAALEKMPADVLTLAPEDCRRRILAGEAALAIAYESPPGPDAGSASAAAAKRADGIEIGFAPLPGARSVFNRSIMKWETLSGNEVHRVPLTGFRGLCAGVSSSATEEQAQAAWNLLTTLTAPGNLEGAFPGPARSPCRTSHLDTPANWTGAELTSAEARDYIATAGQMLRDTKLAAELPAPNAAEFRRRLSQELTVALKDEKPPGEAMKAVQQTCLEAAKETGLERIRDTCRRRIGLPPKP